MRRHVRRRLVSGPLALGRPENRSAEAAPRHRSREKYTRNTAPAPHNRLSDAA
jgi:hypothetical protein